MKQTEYAFAVASVRAAEVQLLQNADLQRLLDAGSDEERRRIAEDLGVQKQMDAPNGYMAEVWRFLSEIAPDIHALEFLIVKNDFHNLKAAIKGQVTGKNPENILIKPCITEPEQILEAVRKKDFDSLPVRMSEAAREGYEIITETMDGQLFDMRMDSASFAAMQKLSEDSGSAFCMELCQTLTALTDLKIALRLSEYAKSKIPDYAFCPCEKLDIAMLKSATEKGKDMVLEYLESTEFASMAEAAAESFAAWERAFDCRIAEELEIAKRIGLGIEPLVAYYYAREAEWKNLRIVLGGKHAGISGDAIRERMCEAYV